MGAIHEDPLDIYRVINPVSYLMLISKRARNEALFKKVHEGKSDSISPLMFFWPHYRAFMERYILRIVLLGDNGVGKHSLMVTEIINDFANLLLESLHSWLTNQHYSRQRYQHSCYPSISF